MASPARGQIGHRADGQPATIDASSGACMTFGELNSWSARLAGALRAKGLEPGDRVALMLENRLDYLSAAWAVRRAELRYVPINIHLGSEEARYLVEDCDAKALITSAELADLALGGAANLLPPDMLISLDAGPASLTPVSDFTDGYPQDPSPGERDGVYMFYSSGTTGRPKGILRPLPEAPFGTMRPLETMVGPMFGFHREMVFYNPAPLYHAAPLGWCMSAQMYGATAVIADRFDPEAALATIEKYRVTHAQFVPTHFVRMLKLPPEVRARYDLSSLEVVIHAAAPCPVAIKEAMIEWLGPIVREFYSGSEGGGFTMLDSAEWLAHKGSVGRSIGAPIHIVDDAGNVLPPGEIGTIYFEDAERFVYHKDAERTDAFFNDRGWGTLGDIGWLDAEGYLYLTDRRSHMIISGGVNIYPQELEDLLVGHPSVADAAVIGVPDPDMGEQVKAVVVPADSAADSDTLAAELVAFCRERLAHYKCPRSVDLVPSLPRLPTGKLLKRELRKTYWPAENLV